MTRMRTTGTTGAGRARAGAVAGSLMLAAMLCAVQRPGTGTVLAAVQTGLQTGAPGTTRQTGGTTPASVGSPSALGPPGALDTMSSPFPDLSRQKRNDERQRRLVSDTVRLLALTSQLKAEVAGTGAESLSPEMLKQMEEIEKLAKSVKDKMRD